MIKYFIVCFELGYEVEDMTELYDSLTGLFGYGGTVEREKDGKVTGFKLQTKYGILRLDYEKKVLELEAPKSGRLSSEDIGELYGILKKALIVRSDKTWYIEARYMFEVV